MGNRHHDKKTRAAVRAAMAETGETYQAALCRLRNERPAKTAQVDLIPVAYFGVELTLATFEILGDLSWVVTSSLHLPQPCPRSPLFSLTRRRSLS
jgi:hypothetical protein